MSVGFSVARSPVVRPVKSKLNLSGSGSRNRIMNARSSNNAVNMDSESTIGVVLTPQCV